MHEVRGQQGAGDEDADEQQCPAQPRVPLWACVRAGRRPRSTWRPRRPRASRAPHVVAPLPQHAAAHADERADRRREGHRVVRVDDALAEAEHEPGDERASRPRGRTRRGRGRCAARAPRHARPATSRMSAAGSSHEIWVPNSAPNMRVRPVAPQRPAWPPAAADAAGLVAGEAAEAVVAEDQVEDAVVLRAADVRARRRRPQRDDRDPPAGRRRAARRTRPSAARRVGAATPAPRPGRRAPNAGTTRSACSILVRKPKPTSENASTSHQVLPRSSARISA